MLIYLDQWPTLRRYWERSRKMEDGRKDQRAGVAAWGSILVPPTLLAVGGSNQFLLAGIFPSGLPLCWTEVCFSGRGWRSGWGSGWTSPGSLGAPETPRPLCHTPQRPASVYNTEDLWIVLVTNLTFTLDSEKAQTS